MSGRRPGGGLLGQVRGLPREARRLAQRVKPAADWPGLSPSVPKGSYRVHFLSIFCPGQRRQAQWAGVGRGGWMNASPAICHAAHACVPALEVKVAAANHANHNPSGLPSKTRTTEGSRATLPAK